MNREAEAALHAEPMHIAVVILRLLSKGLSNEQRESTSIYSPKQNLLGKYACIIFIYYCVNQSVTVDKAN